MGNNQDDDLQAAVDLVCEHRYLFNDLKHYSNVKLSFLNAPTAEAGFGDLFKGSKLHLYWTTFPEQKNALLPFVNELNAKLGKDTLAFKNTLSKTLKENWVRDESTQEKKEAINVSDTDFLNRFFKSHPDIVELLLRHQQAIENHHEKFSIFLEERRLRRPAQRTGAQELERVERELASLESVLEHKQAHSFPEPKNWDEAEDYLRQYAVHCAHIVNDLKARDILAEDLYENLMDNLDYLNNHGMNVPYEDIQNMFASMSDYLWGERQTEFEIDKAYKAYQENPEQYSDPNTVDANMKMAQKAHANQVLAQKRTNRLQWYAAMDENQNNFNAQFDLKPAHEIKNLQERIARLTEQKSQLLEQQSKKSLTQPQVNKEERTTKKKNKP